MIARPYCPNYGVTGPHTATYPSPCPSFIFDWSHLWLFDGSASNRLVMAGSHNLVTLCRTDKRGQLGSGRGHQAGRLFHLEFCHHPPTTSLLSRGYRATFLSISVVASACIWYIFMSLVFVILNNKNCSFLL